jgi:hypothetical protein
MVTELPTQLEWPTHNVTPNAIATDVSNEDDDAVVQSTKMTTLMSKTTKMTTLKFKTTPKRGGEDVSSLVKLVVTNISDIFVR